MGKQSRTNPRSRAGMAACLAAWLLLMFTSPACGQTPLLLPAGIAYDAQGNLYFSDAASNLVRKLSPGGTVTIFAGNGTEGFSGDGGPATASELDAPGALAIDASGDVFIADVHNHRIRRVDGITNVISTFAGTGSVGPVVDGAAATAGAVAFPSALAVNAAGDLYFADLLAQRVRRVDHKTGVIATVAGTGVQGFSGDGGAALAASLDSPSGLALDAAGNLFLSDGHNARVRRVDAVSGMITTVAGTGLAGYPGGAAASTTSLRLPRGLTVDAAGNLFLVDAGNQRIRRVDATTGQITTIAGQGVEGFSGDGGPAVLAALDMPGALALSPAGLPTLTDSENMRVRQVDSAGIIHTIVGIGAVFPSGLVLSGPGTTTYGSGAISASLAGALGTGSIVFLDGTNILGTIGPFTGSATLSLAALPAGHHTLIATYTGDATHALLTSNTLPILVMPAPVTVTPNAITQVYGLPLPALTGTLTGVFAQDASAVQVSFSSAATAMPAAGTYPISATLTGAAAGNYALTTVPTAVMITRAAANVTLTSALLAEVTSSTSGQPGGTVTLLDGGTASSVATVSVAGSAQFSSANLSTGSHTLSARYAGDANFLGSTSPPVLVTIGPASGADFTLASTGPTAQTVPSGTSAVYSLLETPVNGGPSSQIVLSVTGLPAGATATFNPTYLPPASTASNFTLTIQTLKTAGLGVPGTLLFAGLLGLLLLPRRGGRAALAGLVVLGLCGCGDRVTSAGQDLAASRTYNVTVNATSTSNSGATLLHSVSLTLTTD